MRNKTLFNTALLCCSTFLPALSHSAACIVSAETRADAARILESSCSSPVKDCDQVNGRWFCSTENINRNTALPSSPAENPAQQALIPSIVTTDSPGQSCVDDDGDGWGWDGSASCNTSASGSDTITQYSTTSTVATLPSLCVDSDGDGWGWNGTSSCSTSNQSNDLVAQRSASLSNSLSSTNCVDDDGDGWGWDGSASCATNDVSTVPNTNSRSQYASSATSDTSCSGPYSPHDITDLILVTGQSNVAGAQTDVSANRDQWDRIISFKAPDEPHQRVFAWTVDPRKHNAGTGWQTAALTQSWHDSAPGAGGLAQNNFAFHFAKQVANRAPCKVIGFIIVSESGRGISHWDNNATGWNEVVLQVTNAMSAIGRSTIDGILWHQGESDWITDGTCFATEYCRNNQPDYYSQKLYSAIADQTIPNAVGSSALLDRLRAQSWYSEQKPFIAGETLNAPVNIHLNKLNTDNDHWTACVDSDFSSGLGIREDDPFQNHYNADGLRALGELYADEYLRMISQ